VTCVIFSGEKLTDLALKIKVMEVATKVQHTFSVSIRHEETLSENIMSSGKRIPIKVTPPPEFGGSDMDWSPEHLLAASLASCYSNTFFHFTRLLKIKVENFSVKIEMEVEKEEKGPFTTGRFILYPKITFTAPVSQSAIDNLLEKTKKYCIISNSVKGEVIIQPQIEIC
jgi:organic hydroperoxide reductase OsmC/OhrA